MLRRTLGIVVIAAAALVAGVAWYATLTWAPATGPRRMTWHKPDGTPPVDPPGDAYPFDGCDGDMSFSLAVWNGGVILPCEDEAIGAGWAFLDPRTGDATLRWPVAVGKTPVTRGLIAGPAHQLAIVFEAPLEGDLFVAIARGDGWARLPDDLGDRVYRAAAWVGTTLEVVTSARSGQDRFGMQAPLEVITLDGATRRMRTALPACDQPCVMPEIAYRAAGRWVFERDGSAVAEGGAVVAAAFEEPYHFAQIDRVAHGVLDVPATLALGNDTPVLTADGRPAHAPPPPRDGLTPVRQARYTIDDAVHRRPQWVIDREYRSVLEQSGGRTLSWDTDRDDRVRITDARVAPGEIAPVAPVARWRQGLANRVFVPDDAGGFWLVDGSGRYLHLDRALHRTDPLPLREHLRQRGSLGPHIDEPEHAWQLGWILGGLPLLVIGGLASGWIFGPRRPIVRARPVVMASLVYLATAAWAVSHLASLL